MEIEVVKKQKNLAEFIIKGERHTFPSLLKSRLLDDSSVEFVSYVLDHPLDKDSRFVVKNNGKIPSSVLLVACKKIDKDLSEFESAVKKSIK